MDYTSKTRSLQSLVKDMNKGTINLSHKLQRPEGQWNRKQKSDLIDSLLRHYPINPTYAIVEEDGTLSVIDGVQRLSTIRDYIENIFALSKNINGIIINGEEKNDDTPYDIYYCNLYRNFFTTMGSADFSQFVVTRLMEPL